MLHVDINKSHVNIIMLHVDMIYLACRGQKYATIQCLVVSFKNLDTTLYNSCNNMNVEYCNFRADLWREYGVPDLCHV